MDMDKNKLIINLFFKILIFFKNKILIYVQNILIFLNSILTNPFIIRWFFSTIIKI
jgi:hypothetical protein